MKPWSLSTHNCFRRCQRQYYFQHIMASHNARDSLRREAHLFRQLRSIYEWQGHLIHLAMERYFVPSLQKRQIISSKELTDHTIRLGHEQYQFSQSGRYKEAGLTKIEAGDTFLALWEHEYKKPVNEAEVELVFERIKQCYAFLYSEKEFLNYISKGTWYSAEQLLNFTIDGKQVTARLDVVVGFSNGKLSIIDWKIGESQTSDYSTQLRLYALAALDRWPRYNVEDLTLIEANLLKGKFISHSITPQDLLKVDDFIYRSLSEITAIKNSNKFSLEDLSNYNYANSPLSCEFCKFERLCVRLSND